MRTTSYRLVALLVGLLTLSLASLAAAQPEGVDEDEGRELATEAMKHYKEEEFEKALERFEAAEAVYPTAQVLRMKGYTLMALERWMAAAEMIEAALESDFKPLVPKDEEHAQDQLEEALSHLAVVKVTANAPDATVAVDGGDARPTPADLWLEPGAHRFVVDAPTHEATEREEELPAGEHDLSFALQPLDADAPEPEPEPETEPKPPPEPESSDSFGWFPGQGPLGLALAGVGLAVGGAGLGGGLYGLSLRDAVQENIDAHNAAYDPECRTNTELCKNDVALINRDGERARDWQNVGLVMGIAGGSAFVVGALLFFTSDDSPFASDGGTEGGPDEVRFRCTPGLGLSCHGRF